MTTGPFRLRVRTLRQTWEDLRQVRAVALGHDLESQLKLLRQLHTWALEAAEDISEEYEQEFSVVVDPPPTATTLAFSITLGGTTRITLSLAETQHKPGPRWRIQEALALPGMAPGVPSHRRNGPWSRVRLETLLLTALAAFERSRGSRSRSPRAATRMAVGH